MALYLSRVSELTIPPFDGGLGAFILQDFVELPRLFRFGAFDRDIQFQRMLDQSLGFRLSVCSFIAQICGALQRSLKRISPITLKIGIAMFGYGCN